MNNKEDYGIASVISLIVAGLLIAVGYGFGIADGQAMALKRVKEVGLERAKLESLLTESQLRAYDQMRLK